MKMGFGNRKGHLFSVLCQVQMKAGLLSVLCLRYRRAGLPVMKQMVVVMRTAPCTIKNGYGASLSVC